MSKVRLSGGVGPVAIEEHWLDDDGLVPNNVDWPLRIYRAAFAAAQAASGPGAENVIEAHFAANGWSGAWVNGIYDFHHYHASSHEVLGLARGFADVQFGGASGPVVRVAASDAVFIPAGVGHCRVGGSGDLTVVGAYPGGMAYDTRRATPAERLASLPLISRVPRPRFDPVTGDAT